MNTPHTLAAFIQRLERVEGIIRIVTGDAPVSVLFTFRGDSEVKVLLDLTRRPCRVVLGEEARDANIWVTVSSEVMHRVFLGKMHAGEALAQRELLLRGSPFQLGFVIPLFDFATPLYREHLAVLAKTERAGDGEEAMEQRQWKKQLQSGVNAMAWGMGYGLGAARAKWLADLDLYQILEAMAQGLEATSSKNADQARPE